MLAVVVQMICNLSVGQFVQDFKTGEDTGIAHILQHIQKIFGVSLQDEKMHGWISFYWCHPFVRMDWLWLFVQSDRYQNKNSNS